MDQKIIKQKIKSFAKKQGFDLVGFTKTKIASPFIKAYKKWIDQKYQAEMEYMNKKDQRENVQKILPNAKSIVILGINYYQDQKKLKKGFGRIARYAYGRDYHKVIRKKLKIIEKFIKEICPHSETKSFVDTGPLLEKALAEQAGIGFIGKNSCLITQEFGSWIFLSEIITTVELNIDESELNMKCGSCNRCMEACPTNAIIAPGVIDANKCLSYLTIENKGSIPEKFKKIIKQTGRVFGCDICQEVCPHNIARQNVTKHKEFTDSKIAGDQIEIKKISLLNTDQKFLKTFAGSPLMRAKRKGLQRNLKPLTENYPKSA